MRHRIDVENPSKERDDVGQPLRTWTTKFATREPAAFEQVNGGEFLRGRQVSAQADAIFIVNYRDGYTTKQRILFDGIYYDIKRVHTPRGIKRFLELEAKATGV